MKRSGRAWILLPVVIIAAAVAGWVVSSYQKEAGLMEPNPAGVAAVAAAEAAREASAGTGADDYCTFGEALLVATVAQINMPVMNAADTRLEHMLAGAIDCLTALREAWQADVEQVWDPDIHGAAAYWTALHPALAIVAEDPLSPDEIRDICRDQAGEIIEEATDFVG
ncbi:MAG: hypothetical protein JXA87_03435 [Thermoleophilia bacterium]|nr:hypothetical protein [Thermoleophilia bacterium]